jgi:imidazolonepropionase-like amidohydrolase
MPDKPLLVSADRLVDGRGGAPLADAGVLVDAQGTISWAGPMAQAPQLPDECRRVALPGTLLPGFIDTHVHFAVPGGGLNVGMLMRQPPPVRVLQIAANMRTTVDAGVTTVRDLGYLGPKLAMMATTGATPAPRLLNAIAMLSSTGGHGDFPLPDGVDMTELFAVLDLRLSVADGPDEVTKHARQLMRDGAQVIKVAATGGISTPADGPDDVGFSPAELRAVVETAASRGRTVAAHAIGTQGIANAVDAGVSRSSWRTWSTQGCRLWTRSSPVPPPPPTCAGSATRSAHWSRGKRADLVVAAGDPLDDIKLLADAGNITLVVQDGRIVKHTTESVER